MTTRREAENVPPLHELPWIRVEIQGESGQWFVFAAAVHDGKLVGGAPVARRMFGLDARSAWKMYRRRGAKLERMDP